MKWEQREFYERGKPVLINEPPQFTYHITRLYQDLWFKLRELSRPYDVVFTLEDDDISVSVRIVRSEVAAAESWSINHNSYIFNDCGAKKNEILKQLDAALTIRCCFAIKRL